MSRDVDSANVKVTKKDQIARKRVECMMNFVLLISDDLFAII